MSVSAHPTAQQAADAGEERQGAIRGALARRAGRSVAIDGAPSKISAASRVEGLFQSYAPLAYMLPWDALEYVELLATYNADYSQAVENIKMLANSGHTLMVDGQPRTVKKVKDRLEDKARQIQERHGGIDGLIEKLLDQAATFGAMCGEWVLDEDGEDVIDFIDVSPKHIRFFWEDEHWAPYQKVDANGKAEAEARGQKVNGDCIKLNELTFRYYAFDAAPGSPYGTPPFLAALRNIAIQNDMQENLAQIVKKIGLLGIVDMAIKGLPMKPQETQEQYESRAGAYLDSYVEVIEDMIKDGGLVHFDDVETKTWQIGGNAAGATAIFKQNEEMVMSGLKSMPSVQGRSYSTTETYAGVAYEIILRNVVRYQRAARRMIESGYWLMATTWGESPDKIKLKFNNNRTLNRLTEASAEKVEIYNALILWLMGMLDQNGVAQRLGFAEPVTEISEPPAELVAQAKTKIAKEIFSDSEVPPSTSDKMEKEPDDEEDGYQDQPQVQGADGQPASGLPV